MLSAVRWWIFLCCRQLEISTFDISNCRHVKDMTFGVEIQTGKIHMYFVTSVLYEITCITNNTDKPDTDSNPGVWVLIYMTNTVSTNIWRQKKLTVPRSSRGAAAARALFYITEDTCRRAGSATRCTHQRVTVAHKRVPLVPAALSPLLVVTGHRLCIQSAVFRLLRRCPRALLCPHGCN